MMLRNLSLCLLLFIGIGGSWGFILAVVCFMSLTYLVPRFAHNQKADLSGIEDFILFLDIVILGVQSGMSPQNALRSNQSLFMKPFQSDVQELVHRCDAGMSWRDSLQIFMGLHSQLIPAITILIQSEYSGAPIVESVHKLRHIMSRQRESQKIQRIKSVAVRCVLPLGLCFLPAFIVLTIVPIVASLIPQVLQI